jgi:hypothetical protein
VLHQAAAEALASAILADDLTVCRPAPSPPATAIQTRPYTRVPDPPVDKELCSSVAVRRTRNWTRGKNTTTT